MNLLLPHCTFQVLLARPSSCYEWGTLLYSENNPLFFWVCKRSYVSLCFSWRSAHHIARGWFCLAFGLHVCHSSSLLALYMIGMNLHDLSLGSRDRTRLFSPWWCVSTLITLSSPFGIRTTLVGASGKSLSNWNRRCHISAYLLLLWAEFENFCINQSLEHIFEDVATFGGMF